MATSTFKSFLMYKASASAEYTKLADIREFPDMGSAREALDVTTLSDAMRVFIPGIEGGNDNMVFPAWYDPTLYSTVKALKDAGDAVEFAVWFGGTVSGTTVTPTGSEGKFAFSGYPDAVIRGAGVNAARPMDIVITRNSAISFTAS